MNADATLTGDDVSAASSRSAWIGPVTVTALFVLVAATWITWTARDRGLPRGDELRYLAAADRARAAFRLPVLEVIPALGDVNTVHPPLFPVVAAIAGEAVGHDHRRLMVVQLGFLALLLCAVYQAARVLTGPGRAIAAAGLVASFPLAFRYTHTFLLELPATALSATALWLLLAWDRRGGAGRVVLLGVAVGLGLLTKWTVVASIAPAALWLLLARQASGRGGIGPLFGAGAIAAAVAGPWYVTRLPQLAAFAGWNEAVPLYHFGDPASTVAGALFYLERLPLMLGVLPCVLLAVVLAVRLVRPRGEFAVVLWLVVPLVVFTAMRTRAHDGRHLLPALPAAAVLASAAVAATWRPARFAAWLLVLASLPLHLLPVSGLALEHDLRTPIPGTAYTLPALWAEPAGHDDGASAAIGIIAASGALERGPATVAVLSEFGSLSGGALAYLARLDGLPLEVRAPRADSDVIAVMDRTFLLGADFIVVKEGLPVPGNIHDYATPFLLWARFMMAGAPRFGVAHRMIGQVPVRNGDRLLVFRRVKGVTPEEELETIRWLLRVWPNCCFLPDFSPGEYYRVAWEDAVSAWERILGPDDNAWITTLREVLNRPAVAKRLIDEASPDLARPFLAYHVASQFQHNDPNLVLAALARAPVDGDPRLLELRAWAHLELGKPAEAIPDFLAAARLDTQFRESIYHILISTAHERLGHREEARRWTRIAVLQGRLQQATLDNWRDAVELGEIFESIDLDRAIQHYYTALLAAPSLDAAAAKAFPAWLRLMQSRGRTAEVIAWLRRVRHVTDDPVWQVRIGGMLEELGARPPAGPAKE